MSPRSLLCVVSMPLAVACASARAPQPPASDESVAAYDARNASLARELFGIRFDASARAESQANFSGIHSDDLLFSRRIDSRTYFVYDKRASQAGVEYGGGRDQLLQLATRLLQRAGVPASEIVQPRILQGGGRLGAIDPRTKAIVEVKSAEGRPLALVNRQIDGVPVFSSRLLLSASAEGRPAFMELHWPEIPKAAVAEARRLQRLVREGWKPPEQPGARVETVEAGIVHSPAATWVMDIVPVIRVVYASTSPQVGMKALLYYDRSGITVTPPREFPVTAAPCANAAKPREQKQQKP